jgi:hypothetical protein
VFQLRVCALGFRVVEEAGPYFRRLSCLARCACWAAKHAGDEIALISDPLLSQPI